MIFFHARAVLTACLVVSTLGCVSGSSYEQDRTDLLDRVAVLEQRLQSSEQARESLAARLAEVDDLRAAIDAASTARNRLLDQLNDLDHNRIGQLAAAQTEQGALLADLDRVRLEELSGALREQRGRLQTLESDVRSLSGSLTTEAVVELQKDVAELIGRADITRRLAESNQTRQTRLDRSMSDLVDSYNRQSRTLSEYVNSQFVPLARDLVGYLYQQSRQQRENGERLEELARTVDPFQFAHLVPALELSSSSAAPSSESPPDAGASTREPADG